LSGVGDQESEMSNASRARAFGNGMIMHNQRLKSRGVRNKLKFYFEGADGCLFETDHLSVL
jgi:hypothetical protein